MNIFTCDGVGKTYQEASAKALDNFITIYRLKNIKETQIISVNPTVFENGPEIIVSLWVLIKGE